MLTKRHVSKLRLFTFACYDNVLPLVPVLDALWNTLWQILGENLQILSDTTEKIFFYIFYVPSLNICRKPTVNFIMPVRSPVCIEQLPPTGRIFLNLRTEDMY
jgi:hypothetical protein